MANLNDPDYAHLYQKTRNPDYLTFDTYESFTKHEPQYEDYNEDKKIKSVYDVKGCGDCIRGGYIYCLKGPIFGAEYLDSDTKPTGVCCANKELCTDYLNNNEWSCSDQYTDNLY